MMEEKKEERTGGKTDVKKEIRSEGRMGKDGRK
jgi:hypothetical protein